MSDGNANQHPLRRWWLRLLIGIAVAITLFLAITASNLDEFVEVRVAGLLQQVEHGHREPGPDGRIPEQVLGELSTKLHAFVKEQYACWQEELVPALADESIRVLSLAELRPTAREHIENFYAKSVEPLLTPVTDSDQARGSYLENADGYGLTAPMMRWFFDQYADPDVRDDPRIAPLRAPDLSALPPAIVVTAEFDPLRDEGAAYAEALAAAGVPTEHVRARGHTHLSVTMVDLVVSGAPIRAQIAGALRGFFAADAAKSASAQTAG